MKLIEREFESDGGRCWSEEYGREFICNKGLRKLFYIPGGCQTIWVSLWDKPSPNREAVVVVKHDSCGGSKDEFDLRFDLKASNGSEWGDDDLDDFLKKYLGRTLYVQVEYMG